MFYPGLFKKKRLMLIKKLVHSYSQTYVPPPMYTDTKVKQNSKAYIRISLLNLKLRYYNHRQSFNNPLLKNQTFRSKYN